MKTNHPVLLCAIIFSILQVICYSQNHTSNFQKLVSLGVDALFQKDTLKAENYFNESLQVEKNGEAYYQLALINFSRGEYTTFRLAQEFIDKALKIAPGNAEYWYMRGRIHAELFTRSVFYLHSKGESIDSYKKTLELDPKHYESARRLGDIYKDEFSEYHNSYLRFHLPAFSNNPNNHQRQASHLRRQIFTSETESPELSYVIYAREVFTKSENYYYHAIGTDKSNYESSRNLALLYEKAGFPEKGIPLLKNFTNSENNKAYEAELFLGILYYELNNHDSAFASFENAIRLMPKDEANDFKFNSVQILIESEIGENYHKITEDEKRNFINFYWQERDPLYLTKYNERMIEHYYRVAYANLNFGVEAFGIPGWKTNRGEMFIRYGDPLDSKRYRAFPVEKIKSLVGSGGMSNDDATPRIYSNPDTQGTSKTELWDYGDFKLAFSDPFRNDNYVFGSSFNGSQYYEDTQMFVEHTLRKEKPEMYYPEFNGPILDLFTNVTQFKNLDNERTEYYVNYAVPIKSDDDKSPINVGLFLFDKYINPVDKLTFNWNPQTNNSFDVGDTTGALFVNTSILKTRANATNLAVELMRESDKGVASKHESIPVKSFRSSSLMISDIVIAKDIVITADKKYPLTRGNISILPNPSLTVKKDEPFFIYYEVYNLSTDSDKLKNFKQSIRLIQVAEDFDKTAINLQEIIEEEEDEKIALETDNRTNEPIPQVFLQLDMKDYTPGKYLLTVMLTDNQTNSKISATTNLILQANK